MHAAGALVWMPYWSLPRITHDRTKRDTRVKQSTWQPWACTLDGDRNNPPAVAADVGRFREACVVLRGAPAQLHDTVCITQQISICNCVLTLRKPSQNATRNSRYFDCASASASNTRFKLRVLLCHQAKHTNAKEPQQIHQLQPNGQPSHPQSLHPSLKPLLSNAAARVCSPRLMMTFS